MSPFTDHRARGLSRPDFHQLAPELPRNPATLSSPRALSPLRKKSPRSPVHSYGGVSSSPRPMLSSGVAKLEVATSVGAASSKGKPRHSLGSSSPTNHVSVDLFGPSRWVDRAAPFQPRRNPGRGYTSSVLFQSKIWRAVAQWTQRSVHQERGIGGEGRLVRARAIETRDRRWINPGRHTIEECSVLYRSSLRGIRKISTDESGRMRQINKIPGRGSPSPPFPERKRQS